MASTTTFRTSPLLSPRLPPPPSLSSRRTFLRHPNLRISGNAAVSTSSITLSAEEDVALSRVGSRVRVKAPLKVYHIPRVPELELNGLEGVINQYACLWKGNRISANLPFKVEFFLPDGVESRPGPIKFFAHLREDEIEFVSGE